MPTQRKDSATQAIFIAGQVIGDLTVLDPDVRTDGGRRMIRCRCICGRERVVRRTEMQSCAACAHMLHVFSAGQVIGRWTVLDPDVRNGNAIRMARCRCECGKEREINVYTLVRGLSKSCGCMRKYFLSPGQVFGRLTVLDLVLRDERGERMARCRCECGRETLVRTGRLGRGDTISCGCARDGTQSVTHGLSKHPLYQTWVGMLNRCENSSQPGYEHYGARGISVCESWRSPQNFIAWVEVNLGLRAKGMTLDRIDNDGNYEPGNVKWSTPSEQLRNRRKLGAMQLKLLMASGNDWPAMVG